MHSKWHLFDRVASERCLEVSYSRHYIQGSASIVLRLTFFPSEGSSKNRAVRYIELVIINNLVSN